MLEMDILAKILKFESSWLRVNLFPSVENFNNNEIIKIKQDIDTYGGQWLVEKDIERALKNLSMSQKVEAIKSQIKYQKVVLKKNPEDKNLLKFSTTSFIFLFL
jgi:hypothetical protein